MNKNKTVLCEFIEIFEDGRDEFNIQCYEYYNYGEETRHNLLLDKMIRKFSIDSVTCIIRTEKEGTILKQRLFADDGQLFDVTYYPQDWTVEVRRGSTPSPYENGI